MADWEEILSDNEDKISDKDLLKYLSEDISEEEKHELEKRIATTSFESDAVEGLQKIKQPQKIQRKVNQLNKKLYSNLALRKQRKQKGKVIGFRWLLLAILILLSICIITYIIIHLRNKDVLSIHSSLLSYNFCKSIFNTSILYL